MSEEDVKEQPGGASAEETGAGEVVVSEAVKAVFEAAIRAAIPERPEGEAEGETPGP